MLKTTIEETSLLIQQKDRELFEDILSKTISQQLTDRIAESRKWVQDKPPLRRSPDCRCPSQAQAQAPVPPQNTVDTDFPWKPSAQNQISVIFPYGRTTKEYEEVLDAADSYQQSLQRLYKLLHWFEKTETDIRAQEELTEREEGANSCNTACTCPISPDSCRSLLSFFCALASTPTYSASSLRSALKRHSAERL